MMELDLRKIFLSFLFRDWFVRRAQWLCVNKKTARNEAAWIRNINYLNEQIAMEQVCIAKLKSSL